MTEMPKTDPGRVRGPARGKRSGGGLRANPQWFKEAVIYEIPIRAFSDSNGDGVGDLAGVVSRLDYLRDLGVTAIWLLPFYPSPLRDGGYDIADYMSVNPVLGTLEDFQQLLVEAHNRGIRVITELVINHTSKDHPWFERARRSPPGSLERNFYTWSDDPHAYADARIIFKDFETSNWAWDPVANAYYWHRFYSHQPDLNFDNEVVHEALFRVVDFWMDMGVDGMRLDAIPYLYQREGTSCENLPETHAFLRKLRAHVDGKYRDRMLLAEANQWPADAAAYFGQGDECHMNFHFPLMPRIFMALQLEDRFPIVDILRQTPAIPENCQWATFLRNHDELTLEMVTDQDRDYMYRVYAEDPTARLNLGIRRRLSPLLKSRSKVELVNSLLFSLPGTPVLYYGDEIGMGDNIYLPDRDGVRTPMQWSGDRNPRFYRPNPQKLYLPVITDPEYHYETFNVEAQEASPNSLLWWTKRLIAVAKKNKVLGTGAIEFLHPENNKVLAYLRTGHTAHGDARVLVVANLSRYPQYVDLDLAAYDGLVPVEMFGNIRFPVISRAPYLMTLAPYSFFWLRLVPAAELGAGPNGPAQLHATTFLSDVLQPEFDADLAPVLLRYVAGRRWFRGKARTLKEARIVDRIPLGPNDVDPTIVLLAIEYSEGDPETYSIPVVMVTGDEAVRREQRAPHAVIARVELDQSEPGVSVTGERPALTPAFGTPTGSTSGERVAVGAPTSGVLFDAFATGEATWSLIDTMNGGVGARGELGRLVGEGGPELAEVSTLDPRPAIRAPELEQSNTVLFVGDRAMIKIYRLIEPGISPELEVGRFLSAPSAGRLAPKVLGSLQYAQRGRDPAVVAIAHEFVPNEGDAWRLTLDAIELFFERVLTDRPAAVPPLPPVSLMAAARAPTPPALLEVAGRYFSLARQLGARTGDVHNRLADGGGDPAFAREPMSQQHQQSIYQWSHIRLARMIETLRRVSPRLPAPARALADQVIPAEKTIDALLARVVGPRFHADRIRGHGDLHLGQVLFTGDDFIIIDFEGEPARPNSERRYKRSGLRDVMGMIRSFSYATEAVLRGGRVRPEDRAVLEPWADAWTEWVSATYLGSYLQTVAGKRLIPPESQLTDLLLDFYELEKVIYEVEYELGSRPDWVGIPLAGLVRILTPRRSEA
jgi:maltose alpha-D-glucosyltransferase/alpha-amylase